jgi:hypothetical protein
VIGVNVRSRGGILVVLPLWAAALIVVFLIAGFVLAFFLGGFWLGTKMVAAIHGEVTGPGWWENLYQFQFLLPGLS